MGRGSREGGLIRQSFVAALEQGNGEALNKTRGVERGVSQRVNLLRVKGEGYGHG